MKFRFPSFRRRGKNVHPKPLKAAAQDKMRPILMEGWLDEEDGTPVIITTDSYCIVRIPLLKNGGSGEVEPGFIPYEALAYMQRTKAQDFEIEDDVVRIGRNASFSRVETMGKYPDWRAMFKDHAEVVKPLVIGFNATMMKRIADAMATDGLHVTIDLNQIDTPEGGFATYNKALILQPDGVPADDMRLGLQMPIRVHPR